MGAWFGASARPQRPQRPPALHSGGMMTASWSLACCLPAHHPVMLLQGAVSPCRRRRLPHAASGAHAQRLQGSFAATGPGAGDQTPQTLCLACSATIRPSRCSRASLAACLRPDLAGSRHFNCHPPRCSRSCLPSPPLATDACVMVTRPPWPPLLPAGCCCGWCCCCVPRCRCTAGGPPLSPALLSAAGVRAPRVAAAAHHHSGQKSLIAPAASAPAPCSHLRPAQLAGAAPPR